jgi:hypothetical protein
VYRLASIVLLNLLLSGGLFAQQQSAGPKFEFPAAQRYISHLDVSGYGQPGTPPRSMGREFTVLHSETPPRFHWRPALWQSSRFLLVMHAFRLSTEPSTRAELKGPFWGDYFDSVLGMGGWRDGDPRLVNYVGHPLEGAVAGFIFLQNDDRGRAAEFNIRSKTYWKSRLLSTAWISVYSLQFELGLVSEASIGNVGKVARRDGGSYMGTVDLVVTPTLGLVAIVGEDFLDKYAIIPIERRTDNRALRALARGFLNPGRSFANVMRGKPPWHRDTRPLRGFQIESH